jgi:hypothetical protein
MSVEPRREKEGAMSEFEQETISILVSTPSQSSSATPKMKMPRPFLIAFISIVLLFVGWGAWQYWGKLKLAVDSEAQAELDEIELVTPLFDSDQKETSSNSGLGKPTPVILATGKNRRNLPEVSSTGDSSDDSSGRQAEVWLTGTIEVDETNERIANPQRISGGPRESSVQR